MLRVLKKNRKADMDLFPYRLFSIAPPRLTVSKYVLAGELYVPPSVREGDHEVVEGVSVTFRFSLLYCDALSLRSASLTAPSRREPLLQAVTFPYKRLPIFHIPMPFPALR